MSNYNVAFSGLDNVSHAIDTVSNNIANANTVGYKAGQWVFADQFMKAASSTDVARAGMGAQNLSVRRPMIQGTLTTSANPLDLAISGKGMFRLLSPSGISTDVGTSRVDPSALYYTRNGQFSVNKEGYIVNENGMYLTGYQTTADGTLTDDVYGAGNAAGRIMMPAANLVGNKTTKSTLTAILDSTEKAFPQNGSSNPVQFDPRQDTFNHKTTQTIFDNEGNPHTLEVYYRRIEDTTMQITASSGGYTYPKSPFAVPETVDQKNTSDVVLNPNSILRVDTAPAGGGVASTSSTSAGTTTIAMTSTTGAAPQVGMKIFANGVDTGAKIATVTGNTFTAAFTLTTPPPANAAITLYPADVNLSAATTAGTTLNGTANELTLPAGSTNFPAIGTHLYDAAGVDRGTVLSVDQASLKITMSSAISTPVLTTWKFAQALNMTLITPDGSEIVVQGNSNRPGGGQILTTTKSQVEVYSSVDGRFFGKDDLTNNYANLPSSYSLPSNTLGYKPVAQLSFVGGKNIDALVPNPQSGNPTFSTKTTLTTNFVNAAGGRSNLVFNLDLTDTSLQSSAFQITKSVQDGEPMSKLTDVTVDNQGRIAGVYGNGKVRYAGQIALVHFDAFEQLAPVGKNAFSATVASGTEDSAEGVLVGHPGTGEFGEIKSQALESSNVDLSSELVRLMILQRTYSANSQSMKAVDQVMRDTLQMIS